MNETCQIPPLSPHVQAALTEFSAGIDAIQAQHQAYLAVTPSPLPERAGAPAQLRDYYLMLIGQPKVHLTIMDTLPEPIAQQVRHLHQQVFGSIEVS